MSFANDHRLLRTVQLASLAAALATIAACKGPDPSTFACTSSAECPGDYHCDLGTASAAGSNKCVSGAPLPRTLAADASKFLLSKRPSADGSTRTTITADLAAVTSTPDFVGVRLIASQAGRDLADSPVAADGSVLAFQLPQATAQVSLRVQDDSGHSIPVTGYPEQVELSFAGKDVAGNTNPNTAYDMTATSDSLYAPASWISSGPGPGGRATELAVADTLLPDGGIQSSASYSSIAYLDYHSAGTTVPAALQDPTSTTPGTTAGWQELSQIATSEAPKGGPGARVGATLTSVNGVILYGGTDLAGVAADTVGTFWRFNPFQGWTHVVPPAGANAVPTGGAKAGGGFGSGGSTSCATFPCTTQFNLEFSMAGGINAANNPTNRVVAYGTQSSMQTSTSPSVVIATGWFDVGTLPFVNAGMASAPATVPISNSTTTATFDNFAGLIMVGGQGIASGGTGVNSNDQNGCMLYAGYPFGGTVAVANKTISCADGNFNTATGEIGFRTGATLVAIDSQSFLLFGGNKTGGTGGFANGLKNDLWKGTLACNAIAPAATCTTQMTWAKVIPTGTPPLARANAGGGVWQTTFVFTPSFASHRRVGFYGGDAGAAPLTDLWEYDIDANAWRQVPLDPAPALAPAGRTRFAMTGDGSRGYLFGGNVGGAPSDQMWFTSREAPARLLVKAPFSLPAIDQATATKITVDVAGSPFSQAFLWDGTRWRFLGMSAFEGGAYHLLIVPTAPATGFLQPDGNIYLLLMGLSRATPGFAGGALTLDRVKMAVDFK